MKRELLYIAMALCTVCMVSCRPAPKGEMTYPQAEWSEARVKVEWVPLESLIDGYGAAHCMTQVLQRTVLSCK